MDRKEYYQQRDLLKSVYQLPEWQFGKQEFGRIKNDYESALSMTASVWVARCLQLLGSSITGIDWNLRKNEGDYLKKDHPSVITMREVNDEANWADTINALMHDISLFGIGYWGLNLAGDRIIGYGRLNPLITKINADHEGIQDITHGTGKNRKTYSREEVVIFRQFDPLNDIGGLGNSTVAIDKAKTEQNSDKFIAKFFENWAVPPVVMTTDRDVKQTTLDRYVEFWNQLMSGITNAFKVAFVGHGLKPTKIGYSLSEIALKDVRGEMKREICAAFGVPPGLAGAVETANRATWKQQIVSLHHHTVKPKADYIKSVIDAEMMPRLFDEPEFIWRYDKLDFLEEENKEARMAMLVKNGILKPEAAAVRLGYDQDEAGHGVVLDQAAAGGLAITKTQEYLKFRTKAINHFKENGNSEFKFASEIISKNEIENIFAKLAGKNNLGQIVEVFDALQN
jgi:HK97 family phage portal protein